MSALVAEIDWGATAGVVVSTLTVLGGGIYKGVSALQSAWAKSQMELAAKFEEINNRTLDLVEKVKAEGREDRAAAEAKSRLMFDSLLSIERESILAFSEQATQTKLLAKTMENQGQTVTSLANAINELRIDMSRKADREIKP